MTKNLIIILLLFCYSHSYAAETKQAAPNTPELSDWNQVVSYLRFRGILADKINWAEIDSGCAFVKNTTSDLEYNKCRLNKALDQNQYENDRNYCNGVVEDKLFQYTQISRTNSQFFDIKGQQITGVIERKANLSESEIKTFKSSSYIKCMHETGWNNPSSWVNGRRE